MAETSIISAFIISAPAGAGMGRTRRSRCRPARATGCRRATCPWPAPELAAQMNPARSAARHPQIIRLTAATKPRPVPARFPPAPPLTPAPAAAQPARTQAHRRPDAGGHPITPANEPCAGSARCFRGPVLDHLVRAWPLDHAKPESGVAATCSGRNPFDLHDSAASPVCVVADETVAAGVA
jgi:hypothetical protein